MKSWIEYVFFSLARALAQGLSLGAAGRIGAVLGGVVFRCTTVRKRVTLDNLAKAFPEKTLRERRVIALGAFRNYGRAIFEFLQIGGSSPVDVLGRIRWSNPEVPLQALARGHGLIMLGGHFGSWELILPAMQASHGWHVMAIVQPQRNRRINGLVDRQRGRYTDRTVPMARAVREVLRWLREKQVLLLLGDQSGSRESLFIPFFGRPAATHRGAAAFALKSGAPLVMYFILGQPDGRSEIVCEEIDYADIATYTEDHVVELTRRHAAVLERYIRAYPDHWLWMHKRWKHTGFYKAGPGDPLNARAGS
jgi:KDO2-lipid IV(A) lauroyltransferase